MKNVAFFSILRNKPPSHICLVQGEKPFLNYVKIVLMLRSGIVPMFLVDDIERMMRVEKKGIVFGMYNGSYFG